MVFRKLNNDDKTWVNELIKHHWSIRQIILKIEFL